MLLGLDRARHTIVLLSVSLSAPLSLYLLLFLTSSEVGVNPTSQTLSQPD